MQNPSECASQQSGYRRQVLARLGALACLAAASLIASASPAAASITIGQLAPGSPPPTTCTAGFDSAQPSVTAGNTYVVPEGGTITSWSHNAAAGPGQMLTMKVWRQVAGLTYMVVGHDGPRPLAASSLNTFPANIPVKPGDVLGVNSANASAVNNACVFPVTGESYLLRFGDLADGASGTFLVDSGFRVNATAVLVPTPVTEDVPLDLTKPTNAFTFGDAERNKKKGTATLTVNVPNPGELALAGTGLKPASTVAAAAGDMQLKVKAKGKKRRTLNKTGKAKVTPNVTFTPTGGDPSTQSLQLKLKKRR